MTTIHLLYVDDEVSWLEAVRQVLQTDGFIVDTAADGEEALRKIAGQHYDMILLDVRLKQQNGWELVRRFKQADRKVAVVLYTSDYEVEKLTDIFGLGGEDYLEKSSDTALLANRLKALYVRFLKAREQPEFFQLAPEVIFKSEIGVLVIQGEERFLKTNEVVLLTLLCRKMKQVVSLGELFDAIWGKGIMEDSKEKALRNLVSELRKQLEGTGIEIRKRRFVGYYLKNG